MKNNLKKNNTHVAFRKSWTPLAPRGASRVMLFVVALLVLACSQKKNHDEYTCSMHPVIIRDEPGQCPVCGMDLVLKSKPAKKANVSADLNYLLKPANTLVISSIKTIVPIRKQLDVRIEVSGVIAYDTRRVTSVAARYSGRVEKLFVKSSFQNVRPGQKLLEIYSPELVAAQRELLYLLRADRDNTALIESAKEKLELLGLSSAQIHQLIAGGREFTALALYSPVEGYVVDQEASKNSSEAATSKKGMDNGMGTSPSKKENQEGNLSSPSDLQLREGMYVSQGQTIFTIINTDVVGAEFDLAKPKGNSFNVGDSLTIRSGLKDDSILARINFIQPFFNSNEAFIKARVYLQNRGQRFSIGQLVRGTLTKSTALSWWIPTSARLTLGTKEIVFIKKKNTFRPKEITTGRKSGAWVEIVGGLSAHDSISYEAQLMMDSENFIRVKN